MCHFIHIGAAASLLFFSFFMHDCESKSWYCTLKAHNNKAMATSRASQLVVGDWDTRNVPGMSYDLGPIGGQIHSLAVDRVLNPALESKHRYSRSNITQLQAKVAQSKLLLTPLPRNLVV